jgi:hypothetical protein
MAEVLLSMHLVQDGQSQLNHHPGVRRKLV